MKKVFLIFGLLIGVGLATIVFISCHNDNKTKKNDVTEQTDNNVSVELIDNMTGLTTDDEGMIINGVKWATRNVAIPGTFAAKPENIGKLYQWNCDKPCDATDFDNSPQASKTWLTANDPCPEGWRVPTLNEIKTLLDKEKVTFEWTTLNDIMGGKFTDKITYNSIFLPAIGSTGTYWSNRQNNFNYGEAGHNAYCISFISNGANSIALTHMGRGHCVRCVAK